jgi:deaminated glutathione amidase
MLTDQSIYSAIGAHGGCVTVEGAPVRAAAIQLNATADPAENLVVADQLTRAAAADGATLIVLPEKWTAMGSERELRAAAEPLDGATVTWAGELARELRLDLILGSILEQREGGEKLANTSLHLDADGQVRATYRKVHMFDVEVGGHVYRESELEEAGDEIVLTHAAGGEELGMSVCYDLRFPELYRILAVLGARILLVPAAFTLATTRDHWEVLLRARAIENQAFVIAANQFGTHPGGQQSGGRSMIVDPWGVMLAQASDGVGYILAELDLEQQLRTRTSLPSLANRRPSVYRWPSAVGA